jgi:hypothetical protein
MSNMPDLNDPRLSMSSEAGLSEGTSAEQAALEAAKNSMKARKRTKTGCLSKKIPCQTYKLSSAIDSTCSLSETTHQMR